MGLKSQRTQLHSFLRLSCPHGADLQPKEECFSPGAVLRAKDTQILGKASRNSLLGSCSFLLSKQGLIFLGFKKKTRCFGCNNRVTRADNVPFLRGGSLRKDGSHAPPERRPGTSP